MKQHLVRTQSICNHSLLGFEISTEEFKTTSTLRGRNYCSGGPKGASGLANMEAWEEAEAAATPAE